MTGNLNGQFGPNISRVAMPLVRLMTEGNLCWSDKEKVAGLIAALCETRSQMEKEARWLGGDKNAFGCASGEEGKAPA